MIKVKLNCSQTFKKIVPSVITRSTAVSAYHSRADATQHLEPFYWVKKFNIQDLEAICPGGSLPLQIRAPLDWAATATVTSSPRDHSSSYSEKLSEREPLRGGEEEEDEGRGLVRWQGSNGPRRSGKWRAPLSTTFHEQKGCRAALACAREHVCKTNTFLSSVRLCWHVSSGGSSNWELLYWRGAASEAMLQLFFSIESWNSSRARIPKEFLLMFVHSSIFTAH